MPRLWNETIESHRREVRTAIIETAAALVTERGLLAVTMSHIAEETGIGRATLYRYFPDVEAILRAWHERQIESHLDQLVEVRRQASDAGHALRAVLEAYAGNAHASRKHGAELVAFLHRDEHVAAAQDRVLALVRDLIAELAKANEVRRDVPPHELAGYCLNALAAARGLPSRAAIRRLVGVTLAGLQPDS
jgi:AcrR family transcriptional regulator